ncbi:MAG: ATP-binding protein, partial [Spirochaetota bacterium]
VMLAVSDTGTGMSKDTMDHIFEPFFTTKSIGKGTGLGLATVYGAVTQNGGTIDVYSEPGKGTSFKVYFPCENESPGKAAEIKSADALPSGSERILLVEDNPLVLQFSEKTLSLLGYHVLTAVSGEEALLLIDRTPEEIALLMTDVILSGINGKTLADKIKEKRPAIKILFNSGYTADAIVAHGVLNDGLHFLGKPFSSSTLAHKIREILDGKES